MGKLTVKEVQSIIKNAEPGRYSDGGGLYLMIPKSGSPYWMLRYTQHKKRRALTLGKHHHLTLADVRATAEEFKKKIRNGEDPIAERKREEQAVIHTVEGLFNDWYQGLVLRLKHPNIPKRIFVKEIAPQIGRHPLEKVTPMDVRFIVKKIAESNRPTIANDTLMYLKQLFNHGIKLDLIRYNPAAAFNVNDAGGVEKSRIRMLTLDELAHAFQVFRDNRDSFTRDNYLACALLVVLGVRKSELTESKWAEFNLDKSLWNLPAERSKSGTAITIPLPPQAIEWLRELKIRACGSEYVFPSRRASKRPHMGSDTLNRAISKLFGQEPGKEKQPPNRMGDLEYFTVHDLRRTCRSLLASEGVPSHIAERCLNHKLKGVEGTYDRYDYLDERRAALTLVAKSVSPLMIAT
ncbi:site-specific integrase [uncultured Amphritea sp.]|uniref:tyrosine-type recombinase/integrase n=1 Tax=uncultured Amphritea sp. TaxID=981605 RepID=UPI0026175223|nr:site-specific integrase [uncultured Amphritea sp.]